MRRSLVRRMPPEEAHVGRWKADFSATERARLQTEYEEILTRLGAAEVLLPSPLPHCHAV